VGSVLSLLVLVMIGIATLTPSPGTLVTTNLWCIACGEFGALDVLANIVMFLPLGFALALATERRWLPVLLCIATTLIIEGLQVRVIVGRDASLSDLLANSLGGWIGCVLAFRWRTLVQPTGITAARLSVAAAAAFAVITSLTSFGLRPAEVPRSLWVQWLPPRPSFAPFTGRLLSFDINGIDLPLGYPSPSLGLTRVLSGEPWVGTARIDREYLQPTRSVIVRVAEEFTVLVSVEQQGWDLTCQQKTRSADFRFRSPRVRLPDALRPGGGVTSNIARLRCGRVAGALTAGIENTAAARSETVPLTPSLGWLLLSPFDIAVSRSLRWVGALWLFALAFPAGFWGATLRDEAATNRQRVVVIAAMIASLSVGLTLSPIVAGTTPAARWEWLSALGGAVVGAISTLVLARRGTRSPAPDSVKT
jgi:hypothetical protein